MSDHDLLLVRVSAALDGEEPVALPDPLPPGAEAFRRQALELRAAARIQIAVAPPDLVAGILAELDAEAARRSAPRHRNRLAVAAAAVFLAGCLAGATIGGVFDRGVSTAVADLADDVLAAQVAVERLDVDVEISERGWDPAIPIRTFRGRLTYSAPDRLTLELDDTTDHPAGRWPRNDVLVVVDESEAWTVARLGCPIQLRPGCIVEEPLVRHVVDRVPFSSAGATVDGAPLGVALPLDLVVPTGTFVSPGVSADTSMSIDRTGGTVIVSSTVARFESLVGGLLSVGDWRAIHPTDRATVHLDAATMTLRGLTVTAADGVDRDLWARRHGYADEPGSVLIEATFSPRAPGAPTPEPPSAAPVAERSEGFDPSAPADPAPEPAWLPDGFEPYRSGRVVDGVAVGLRSYTDGRAWLVVRATGEWEEPRMFGEIDPLARPVDVPGGGRLYLDPSGMRVGLHAASGGRTVDVEVSGSIGSAALIRVASSLGVVGTALPSGWLQAPSTESLPEGALTSDRALSERVDDGVVTVLVPGPGQSGFTIVQLPGSTLDPPTSPDVVGVVVRGVAGRWDPDRGHLEWVERGWVVSVRSDGLGLAELVAVAGGLHR